MSNSSLPPPFQPGRSPPPPSPQPVALADQQYLVSDNQVLVSVYVNALWGGLCIFGFVVLRGWVRGPGGVFQRRQELQDLFMRPPRLVLGTIRQVWNWLLPLLAVSDADIVSCSGFDALILTRVLLMGLQMFTMMTFFGMVVLIPVYYTRGGVEQSSASLGTMARLSVANIPTSSKVFLLPFGMTYVFIVYGCWVLLINCKCYVQLRMAYFCCLDALPSALEGDLNVGASDSTIPTATAASGIPSATAATASRGVVATANERSGSAAAVAAPTVACAVSSSSSSITHDERHNARYAVPGSVVLELPQLRGGGHDKAASASASAAQPVAEGVESAEAAAAEQGEGAGQEVRQQRQQSQKRQVGFRDAVACTADGGSTAYGGATEESVGGGGRSGSRGDVGSGVILTAKTPRMALRSTWLNMANFFNPTLRMMLDYLDWQNPLQRIAARFGVHDLQLPTVTADEAPRAVRLYNSDKDPLLSYDDLVSAALTSSGDDADLFPSGNSRTEELNKEDCGEGPRKPVSGNESHDNADAAAANATVVLPYWRPLESLRLMRETGSAPAGYEVAETHCANRSSATSPTCLRIRGGVAASATASNTQKGANVAGSCTGGGGAAAPASAASFFPSPRYSLRHSTNVGTGPLYEVSTAMTATTPAMGTAATARSYGMTDPRQPLLPGKRNVRLLQLLQIAMSLPFSVSGDGSGGGCGYGFGAHIRCPTMRATAGSGATNVDGDPIRLVNASHYVVLIKRVDLKLRPGVIDRMAAMTYIAVNRLRRAFTWAKKRTAKAVTAGMKSYHGGKQRLLDTAAATATATATATAAAGASAVHGDGAASGPSGSRAGRSSTCVATTGQCRTARDVEAQAVAMAAGSEAGAGTAMELHGLARIEHDVRRYFEMFDDPGKRQFDPLKDVSVASTTRTKSKTFRRLATTASNGGGVSVGTSNTSSNSGGGAAAGADMTAAAITAATTTAFTAIDADAVAAAAAAKVNADAEEDPNGAAVAAVLHDLFPKTFQGLIPVSNHDAVDKLIYRWDTKMTALAVAVRDLERLEAWRRRRLNKRSPQSDSQTEMEEGKGSEGAVAAAEEAEGLKRLEASAAAGKVGGGDSRLFKSCCGGSGDGDGDGSSDRAMAAALAKMMKVRKVISKLRTDILDLEARIDSERERTMRKPVGTAYFAMFSSSKDAQMLGQCRRVVPPQGPGTLLSFDAVPAPNPEDVSWPALWSTSSLEQFLRRAAIVLPMAIIFALPIGPFQGALASLDVSLCGGVTSFEGITSNKLYVGWFCEPKNLGIKLWKALITGVLPSVLGLLWTALIMPQFLYFCSSIARSKLSLSGQERQMQDWFFWYSLINTFLGAVLGSGVFSQLGGYLADPKKLLDKIGRALPSTANFFIQFCIARALFTNFVRLLWPHAGSMFASIFRSLLRLGLPRSLHAAALAHMPPSTRAISYYNAILQIFMFGCAFAVVSPVILPCCWLFFLTGFFAYRYSILYVYERNYESGGRMWPVLFGQMMGFLLLMEVFTGAVLVVNKAWVLAVVIWVTLTPPLLMFWRYCFVHYLEPVEFPPLSVVASEPRGVRLSPLVYMPPALRPGALGWYPEQGKVWQKYGIPKHW